MQCKTEYYQRTGAPVLQGEVDTAEFVQHGEEEAQEDLNVYKYLKGGCKESGARLNGAKTRGSVPSKH